MSSDLSSLVSSESLASADSNISSENFTTTTILFTSNPGTFGNSLRRTTSCCSWKASWTCWISSDSLELNLGKIDVAVTSYPESDSKELPSLSESKRLAFALNCERIWEGSIAIQVFFF
eukprot:TRINITY_DN165_c0_g1_i3.p1 TRINITY_DN165_c0_g1~~TRINITY_DN165_c0_g1_i3.p1  ORF type:complete len:119 (+),score=11.03 TRINITY_DN165_c0_g1_i3:121-477(+)